MNAHSDGETDPVNSGENFEDWAASMCKEWVVDAGATKKAAAMWIEANPDLIRDPHEAVKEFRPDAVLFHLMTEIPGKLIERELGIPAIPVYFNGGLGSMLTERHPQRPALYAMSHVIDPGMSVKDAQWDHVTGHWALKEEVNMQDHPKLCELRDFIEAGDRPPVAIGWGSTRATRGVVVHREPRTST